MEPRSSSCQRQRPKRHPSLPPVGDYFEWVSKAVVIDNHVSRTKEGKKNLLLPEGDAN